MCGRYFQTDPADEVAHAFGARPAFDERPPPRFNVAPTQPVLAVRFDPSARECTLSALHWGLIPHFAKDRKSAYRTINARAETVDSTSSFRSAFEKRRCLVVASGFFEWRRDGEHKQPFAFALRSRASFGFAGLWENWKDPATGDWVRSCTIITTTPNELVAQVHDRMPVILPPEHYATWLGEEPATPDVLKALLRPFDAAAMETWPVSPRVNNARNEDPHMLEPIELPRTLLD